MEKQAAKAIMEASCVLGDMDIRMEEYFGRGMYGESTVGIVASIHELLPCIAMAAAGIVQWEREDYNVEQFVEDVSHLRTDSLGRGTIWY